MTNRNDPSLEGYTLWIAESGDYFLAKPPKKVNAITMIARSRKRKVIQRARRDGLARAEVEQKLSALEPRPLKQSKSYLYIIGAANGPVKVGYAKAPQKRLVELQVGSPFNLKIHHRRMVDTSDVRRLEADCHKALSDYALRGEWFDIHPAAAILLVNKVT